MKVDFSSSGCQKLPNWEKITHQNADLLQLVRKIFYIFQKNDPPFMAIRFYYLCYVRFYCLLSTVTSLLLHKCSVCYINMLCEQNSFSLDTMNLDHI